MFKIEALNIKSNIKKTKKKTKTKTKTEKKAASITHTQS